MVIEDICSLFKLMKISYYSETDSLYIDLSDLASSESKKISEGVVLDYDEHGNLVGIDIDNASKKLNLQEMIVSKLPLELPTEVTKNSKCV